MSRAGGYDFVDTLSALSSRSDCECIIELGLIRDFFGLRAVQYNLSRLSVHAFNLADPARGVPTSELEAKEGWEQ